MTKERYYNITENSILAKDVKKYLDYTWEHRNDLDGLSIEEMFNLKADPDRIYEPILTDYFQKELINSWIGIHHNFMQLEDKIYAKIEMGSHANDPDYYKEVLESLGIKNFNYILLERD